MSSLEAFALHSKAYTFVQEESVSRVPGLAPCTYAIVAGTGITAWGQPRRPTIPRL